MDKRKLIEKKYITRGDKVFGYVTGPQVWNEWGITTQIPKRIWIAQEIRQRRGDSDLNVVLMKAKGEIRGGNIKALQFLDIIEQMENIQDASNEEIIKKLITIYKEEFGPYYKIAMFQEVRKYGKKVQVIFGLIAEGAEIEDEYLNAALEYLKEGLQKGKKMVLDIEPKMFNNNRSWGNGYAFA